MQIAAYQKPIRRIRLAKCKVCYKCPENGEQPLENFYKSSAKCKECFRKDYQRSKHKFIDLCETEKRRQIQKLSQILNSHYKFFAEKRDYPQMART